MSVEKDIWSEWLRHRRFGGNASYQAATLEGLKKLASKIVERAQIFESAVVLDIGAGDGVVGLTALQKLGPQGKLILSDISEAALAIPKEMFNKEKNSDSRVQFLVSGIENISSLPDGSIDREVMRAVLLYVENKQAALNEIFRVLRQGGIAVLMEPINQRHVEFETGFFRGYRLDCEPLLSVRPLLQKVADETKRQRPIGFVNYNEHDLVHWAVKSGFEEIELEYSFLRTANARFPSWEAFVDSAPNPLAMSLRELMIKILTPEEFVKAESALKKVVQQSLVWTNAEAILILKK